MNTGPLGVDALHPAWMLFTWQVPRAGSAVTGTLSSGGRGEDCLLPMKDPPPSCQGPGKASIRLGVRPQAEPVTASWKLAVQRDGHQTGTSPAHTLSSIDPIAQPMVNGHEGRSLVKAKPRKVKFWEAGIPVLCSTRIKARSWCWDVISGRTQPSASEMAKCERTKELFVLESASERLSFLSAVLSDWRALRPGQIPAASVLGVLFACSLRRCPQLWGGEQSSLLLQGEPCGASLGESRTVPSSSLGSAGFPYQPRAFLCMEVQVLNIHQFWSLPLLLMGPHLHPLLWAPGKQGTQSGQWLGSWDREAEDLRVLEDKLGGRVDAGADRRVGRGGRTWVVPFIRVWG